MHHPLCHFKNYLMVVKQLYARVCMKPIQSSTVEYDSIFAAIARWTTDEAAAIISQWLHMHFQTSGVQINAFCASVVFWFGTDEIFWLVIEWTEESGIEGLALFYLDQSDANICSYIIHRVQKMETDEKR